MWLILRQKHFYPTIESATPENLFWEKYEMVFSSVFTLIFLGDAREGVKIFEAIAFFLPRST